MGNEVLLIRHKQCQSTKYVITICRLLRFQVQIVCMIYSARRFSSSGSFNTLPPISLEEIEMDEMDAIMVQLILSNYRFHKKYLNISVGEIKCLEKWHSLCHPGPVPSFEKYFSVEPG